MEEVIFLEDTSDLNAILLDCKFRTEYTTEFHYQTLLVGSHEKSKVLEQNVIIFIVEGSCYFSCDKYLNRELSAGDFICCPKSSMVTRVAIKDTKFVCMAFDTPLYIKDKQYFECMKEKIETSTYNFIPLKINNPTAVFIRSVIYFLENGGDSLDLHEIKHREIFFILRMYYTEEQLIELLYPVIIQSSKFKNFVLDNYSRCHTMKDLIDLSNISANAFMRKFKEEFGVSGYQWMLKQMCTKMVHKASQPEVTIKEIMFEVGIQSPTHFNRVCKRYFNQTPKQFIAFCQRDI